MAVNINVRISDEQAKKIRYSGMKISDYTREALNYYNIQKGASLLQYKIDTIQECIELLEEHKMDLQSKLQNEAYKVLYNSEENVKKNTEKSLYNSEENVKKNTEKSLYNSEENVKKIYNSNKMSLQSVKTFEDQSLYNSEENVKKNTEDGTYTKIKKYMQILSKMLHLHGHVPEATKQKIKNETGVTNKEINDFIVENRELILSTEYMFSDEHVKSMPGDKKYKE